MMKRICTVVFTILLMITMTACDFQKRESPTHITMYLWDKSMSKQLTPWLEEQFPNVDFTFLVGYNSISFYQNLLAHGDFPDIITCRRFSLNDAAKINGQLLDMSQTELVGTFYSAYIENNRDVNGAIKWLPMCAEIDGFLANLDVFESCGVELPTCYAEFAEACSVFEANGIRCFENDYLEDYSCLEIMQGCAIPELTNLKGVKWRIEYESEKDDEQVALDEQVWNAVFEKFERFLKDTYARPSDAEMNFRDMKSDFLNGKCAIIRGTGNDCVVLSTEENLHCVMLPFYGETADDNWLLTYPIYQVAVNKDAEKDPAKKEIIMKVLERMFSEEGQRMAAAGSTVITYNETVGIELRESLAPAKECVEANHLYQRLASTEIFAISKDVASKMIRGEYGPEEAFEDFNKQLVTPPSATQDKIVASLNTNYDYAFTSHGNPAASAVINTLRKQLQSDALIGYSTLITSSVYSGDYTEQQLNWLVCNRAQLRSAQMTGTEICEVMEWLVDVKENGANPVRHKNLLPVVSGIEYVTRAQGDGTFALAAVTMNGMPLEEEKTYSVLLLGDDGAIENEIFCGCPMPDTIREMLQPVDGKAADHLMAALSNGSQMEKPTEYVTILQQDQ